MAVPKIAILPFGDADGSGDDENGYVFSGKRVQTYETLLRRVSHAYGRDLSDWQLHFHLEDRQCKWRLVPSEWDDGAYFDEEFLNDGKLVLFAHFEPELTATASTPETVPSVKNEETDSMPQMMHHEDDEVLRRSRDVISHTSFDDDDLINHVTDTEPFSLQSAHPASNATLIQPAPTAPLRGVNGNLTGWRIQPIRYHDFRDGGIPDQIKAMPEVASGSIEVINDTEVMSNSKGDIIVGYLRAKRCRDPRNAHSCCYSHFASGP